ncbi:MAG: RNA polymerase sigma factor [Gemmatimonadota bacterium]
MSTDEAVVGRVLAGDREAYGELVKRHQRVVYRHIRAMGIDRDTTLDLVQDAFVRAYMRLSECRDRAHFRAWAFRIARNLCLDHLKNVRRSMVPLSDLPGSEQLPDHASRTATQLGEADILRAALEHLPPTLRDAFLLRHDAGYSYDEIAAMTDASVSAVKMRVHRARESLRSFLDERGVHAA